jgi:maleate isomerase
MPDALGYRAKIGVVVPSSNTITEAELYAMAPPGVTFQVGRMYVPQVDLTSAEATQAFIEGVRGATQTAICDVLTTEPDYLLHGMTALSFMGGVAGSLRGARAAASQTVV